VLDATLLVGGTEIVSHKGYSIKKNLENLLARSREELGMTAEKHAAMKTLISDLLTYGAAAQEYTDYKTDSLVTSGVTGIIASTATPTERDAMKLTGNENKSLYFVGGNVHFDTVNEIRIKLYASADALARTTLTVDGETVAPSDLESLGDGYYTVTVPSIYANGMDIVHTFTLTLDGETVATLSYSVNAYAFATLADETASDEMKALALALYRYGVSADEYGA
jgi:hypothetical protein